MSSSPYPRRGSVGPPAPAGQAPSTNPLAAPDADSGHLPSNAYANAFMPLKPRDGAQLVQTRLNKARILADELGDYFLARRDLETAYLKALQKISKRPFLSDPSALPPAFAPVYERLITEIGEVASIHGELERKIGSDCCKVIKAADSRGEWARQREVDDGLSSSLRDMQMLEVQLAKDQKKVEGASAKKAGSAHAKVIETQRSLDHTMQDWQNEAASSFASYQKMDVQRLELMKEVVTSFETIQSDAAQRLLDVAAQSLQVVLSFDPQADMQEFILKNGKGTGASGAAAAAAAASSRLPSRAMPQRSDSVASSLRPGTGAGRGSSAAEFGLRPSSVSIHSTDQQQTPQRSGTLRGNGPTSTLKSALGRFGRGRSNKAEGDANSTFTSLPGDATGSPAGRRSADAARRYGGLDPSEERLASPTALDDDEPLASQLDRSGKPSGSGLIQPLVPTRPGGGGGGGGSSSSRDAPQLPAPQVDSEGFSIPPSDRAEHKPWETNGAAADAPATAGLNRVAEEDREDLFDSTATSSTSRVPGMNISNAPVGISDSSQDKAALERVRSTLLTAGPTRRGTTRRDRRDVRNTTYNPMAALDGSSVSQFGALAPQATGGSAFSTGTPAAASPIAGTFTGSAGVGGPDGRTQSIVSTSSSRAAAAAAAVANPFEATAGTPGLRASIVETVNAVLTSSGVARLMIVGEVSVTLKDVSSAAPLHLRLDSYEQLEKAAPNPAYLKGVASSPGEFTLDVGALSRQQVGSSSARATVLKYQVHVPQGKISQYVPLNVDARWRFEPQQTSFLLTYGPNAECKLAGTTDIEDVSFVANVGPTAVSSVMSKPTGQWNEEQKRIYWKLPEKLSLSSSSPSQKLLARFQVEGEGAAQPVQVRWRVFGQTMSQLGLSVVGGGDGALAFDEVARQTVSGKYFAQ